MAKATATLNYVDYNITAEVGRHKVTVDEPVINGGQDTGPAATDYLNIALASCTATTMKMYANRKQWKIDSLVVEVDKETSAEGKNIFKRTLYIKGTLDSEQLTRLMQIANVCPVHKILSHGNTVETVMGK